MTKVQPMKSPDPIKIDPESSDFSNLPLYEKLNRGIHYLNNLNVDLFFQKSKIIMEILTKTFKKERKEDLYLPWVRFLDVAQKTYGDFQNPEEFKDGMHDILKTLLISKEEIDRRIVRKILGIKQIFHDVNSLLPKDYEASLLKAVKYQLVEALDHFDWVKNPNPFAREAIDKLLELFHTDNEDLKTATVSGRFDKKTFDLKNTIIFGEDGGLYLLLNSVDQKNKAFIEEIVGADYLKDKIVGQKNGGEWRIVLGKGGFGKVRFALNLLGGVKKPSELICIKKSNSYEEIKKKEGFKPSPIEVITDNTLGDYFTNDLAEVLYAPKIVDMAIVSFKELENQHKKGYLMMEVIPQNTGKKIFNPRKGEITEFQKWEHQKPYLIDVLEGMIRLLEKGVAMTDLKPENTLYDQDLRQATIIDLGGTVRPEKKEEIQKFDVKKYDMQCTEGYAAPELMNGEIVDLEKTVAYACGKVIESVTERTDYVSPQEIRELVGQLTKKDAKDRMRIQDTVELIKAMGADDYKEHVIFMNYINKVKERIHSHNNQISIGLNNDIKETRELLIPLEVTTLDPYKYKDLEHYPLEQKIDKFLEDEKIRVFLLLGAAGAGKSIALQLRFIEAVQKWRQGEPLPIYFNLANGIELEKVLEKLNQELKTALSIGKNLKGKNLQLFVDSLDEGSYASQDLKERLIRNYQEQLGKENLKILVSCRSDHPIEERWFTADMEKFFIAPLDFKNEKELKYQIEKYLAAKKEKSMKAEEYIKRIKSSNLTINTGFIFHLVMNALLYLDEKEQITKDHIYQQYVKNYSKLVLQSYTEKQKEKINSRVPGNMIQSFGQYFAILLHTQMKFRINPNQNDEVFKDPLNYTKHRDFQYQLAYHFLQLLPLKIEINKREVNGRQTEAITIGFKHDIIKNYYLAQAIFREDVDIRILSSHRIGEDVELVRYLAEIIQDNPKYKARLLEAILNTQNDKSTPAVTYASNAIMILIAAGHPLSGHDLSNISITGANLSNGLFHKTNFTNADLTGCLFRNANLAEAVFKSTRMTDVKFGVFPDLVGHTKQISQLAYSPNGNTITTASVDGTAKIWNVVTGKVLQNLDAKGYPVNAVAYSLDGKTVVTGLATGNVKVWEVASGQELKSLNKHERSISSVAYSPDIRMIASGSSDGTVGIWDAWSGELLQRLSGDKSDVNTVAFSPDGKTLAAGLDNGKVKIWKVGTYEEVQTLQGHKYQVNCLAYSPDGKSLATCSNDQTIKLWNPTSFKETQTLLGHNAVVSQVVYSPDGKTLASGSADNKVRIWDVNSGKELRLLQGHSSSITGLAYSPEGKTLATSSGDSLVKLWDLTADEELQELQGHQSFVYSVAYSPDGKTLATASDDKTIKLWSAEKEIKTIRGHESAVHCVTYSPDGKTFATCSADHTVRIWEARSGQEIQTFKGHNGSTMKAVYSPDGKTLISCSFDDTAKLWDITSGKELHTLRGHTNTVNNAVFLPDGKTVMTCSSDYSVKIWEVSTGKEVQSLTGHDASVEDLALSADGRTLLTCSADKTVKVWEVSSGKEVKTLIGHDDCIWRVAYSPDGATFITSSQDKTMKIWDSNTYQELETLYGHTSAITCIAYSPDGKMLASGSVDNTVKVYCSVEEKEEEKRSRWLLVRNWTKGPILCASQMILDEVSNLSDGNVELLKQHGCVLLREQVKKKWEFEEGCEEIDIGQGFYRFLQKELVNQKQAKKNQIQVGNSVEEFQEFLDKKEMMKSQAENQENKESENRPRSFWGKFLFVCGASKK